MSNLQFAISWLLVVASIVSAHAAGSDVRLIDAVKAGNREMVRALVGQRVDVNVREVDGTTALHWAVRANDADMATSLMRAGAAANVANRYGVTPLLLAATNGN